MNECDRGFGSVREAEEGREDEGTPGQRDKRRGRYFSKALLIAISCSARFASRIQIPALSMSALRWLPSVRAALLLASRASWRNFAARSSGGRLSKAS